MYPPGKPVPEGLPLSIRIATLLVCAILLLAGCTADEPAPKTNDASPSTGATAAPSSSVAGAAVGTISGQVLDDEARPVLGAQVALVDPRLVVESGPVGEFVFENVPPGDRAILVEKLGYERATRKVTVVEGETAETTIVLQPIPISVARTRDIYAEAYFELAAAVVAAGVNRNVTGADYRDLYFLVDNDVVSTVTGAMWTSGAPGTAKRFYLDMWASTQSCDSVCERLNETTGTSPIILRADNYQDHLAGKSGAQVNPYMAIDPCYTAGSTNVGDCNQDTLVQLAVGQRVKLYITVFFVEPPPDGYSPLPPA